VKIAKTIDLSLFAINVVAAVNFLVFWLTIATFPDFFFFNPLGNQNVLRRFELVLSTLGWISISTLAPILLLLYSAGSTKIGRFLPFCALLWPVSLIVSQVTRYVQSGAFYLGYLRSFPIFIFTDILLPIILMTVWIAIRHHRKFLGQEAISSITTSGKNLEVELS
jgi:hypothetical protein